MNTQIKFEIWKDRRKRVVVRENGKLASWRFIKGSGIKTKQKFSSIFRRNNTLLPNLRREVIGKERKTAQIQKIARPRYRQDDSSKPLWDINPIIKTPNIKQTQYYVTVSYRFEGREILISRRSFTLGSIPEADTPEKCKRQCWKYILQEISTLHQQTYDENIGKKIALFDYNNIRVVEEGWLYFKKLKK